jgi:hypothetical protein
MATIKYKSPYGRRGAVNVRAFKLESDPKANCYVCHVPLSGEEKKHESTFTYSDKDGNVLGIVKTYVCFDCIEILTGRRPDHE